MFNVVHSQQYILHLQLEEAKQRKLSVAADPEGLRYVDFITRCATYISADLSATLDSVLTIEYSLVNSHQSMSASTSSLCNVSFPRDLLWASTTEPKHTLQLKFGEHPIVFDPRPKKLIV